MKLYVLDANGDPRHEPSVVLWSAWMTGADTSRLRIVRQTRIDGVFVSTVFLGLDHNFSAIMRGLDMPVLWESMVFGGDDWIDVDGLTRRYSSREAALAGHQMLVDIVMESARAAGLVVTPREVEA